MIGRDVAGFMADDEGQLCLVVHDAHQLSGDVDVAARYREGILDGAIERGEVIDLSGIGRSRIGRDAPPDAFDIRRARAGFRSPEFGHQGRMLTGSLLHVARVEGLQPLRLGSGRDDDHRARGKQGENVTHAALHHLLGISPR